LSPFPWRELELLENSDTIKKKRYDET
jgi:hypothetical protein